jgi:transposase
VTAADEDAVIAAAVSPGQTRHAPRVEPLPDATIERGSHADELSGGKGVAGDRQPEARVDPDVSPNAPSQSNRVEPAPFDPDGDRERNKVERLVAKANQFRRFATRYKKREGMHLGVVHWSPASDGCDGSRTSTRPSRGVRVRA